MGDLVYAFCVLGFVSSVMTIALAGVFDTDIYKALFGFGVDGSGSRFFGSHDLRPYISNAVGLFLAFSFQIQLIKLGVPSLVANPDFMGNYGADADMILSGLILGGGTKAVVALMRSFKTVKDEATAQGSP